MAIRWAVTPEKLEAAIQRVVEVAHPSRIILFGSVARGDADERSDVDLLVVLPDEPESVREVGWRIDRAVDDIQMSKDILVISEERLAELGDRPSLVYREALREGRVVYEAPDVSPRPKKRKTLPPSEAGRPHWWLKHAQKDLAAVRHLYNDPDEFPEQVCFLAQQAAEKAVKAVLLERNVSFPHTHDLKKLVDEGTKRGLAIPSDVERTRELSRYAVETRYPDNVQEITDQNVADAMLIAEATVAWAAGLVTIPEE
jgi:HEPN domain-containing protein/predicted nucleotidyltransferase